MRTNAFAKIYKQHYAAVYRYALSLTRDAHLAEDLVQETFVKAFLSLDAGRDSMAAWLHVVCRNLWYDHCRKDKRIQFLSGEVLERKLAGTEEADGMKSIDNIDTEAALYRRPSFCRHFPIEMLYIFASTDQQEYNLTSVMT